MGRLALRWAFVESASTLFGGGRVAAGILKDCGLYVSSGRIEVCLLEKMLVGRVIKRVGANYVRHFRASFMLPANLPTLARRDLDRGTIYGLEYKAMPDIDREVVRIR